LFLFLSSVQTQLNQPCTVVTNALKEKLLLRIPLYVLIVKPESINPWTLQQQMLVRIVVVANLLTVDPQPPVQYVE
jgi:hypothetical protein